MSWREIAWNGVRFIAPADWEVAKIGRRYLVLADQGEPAMEIKWEKVKGRFSHRTAFRRLNSVHGGTVQESALPDEWKQILKAFVGAGFTWQTKDEGGRGAILHCPACGNATLVQFFHNKSTPTNETSLRILSTFQDHATDDQVRWSLFDIQAVIPSQYKLAKYRFEAGRYELNFVSKKRRLRFTAGDPLRRSLPQRILSPLPLERSKVNEVNGFLEPGRNILPPNGRSASPPVFGPGLGNA